MPESVSELRADAFGGRKQPLEGLLVGLGELALPTHDGFGDCLA